MPGMTVMSDWLVFSFTVWSSTFVMAPSAALPELASMRDAMRPAIELPSADLSHQRVRLKTTSSALKSSPFDHFTPLRTWRVYSVASSLTSQLSMRWPSKVKSLV